jgi:hypothetical protein
MGLITVFSFTLAKDLFTAAYVSVWCYFAAVSSLVIFAYFYIPSDLRRGPRVNADSKSMV